MTTDPRILSKETLAKIRKDHGLAVPDVLLDCIDALVEERDELASAVRDLDKIHDLGDAIYTVRERVVDDDPDFNGNSWDHPTVTRYSELVGRIRLLTKIPETESHEGADADQED